MKKAALLLFLAGMASCDRTDAATGAAPKASPDAPLEIDMLEFGNFEYVERMALPVRVTRWNGKRVRATGFMNPGRQIRDVKEFELVMNKDTCCYGSRPRMNHFFQVVLKDSSTVYSSDPVTVIGKFVVEETWDGDWPLGLYWLKDAQVVK